MAREEYTPVVGFAREPVAERRRWIGRIGLLLLLLGILWVVKNRVLPAPPDGRDPAPVTSTVLPGPL